MGNVKKPSEEELHYFFSGSGCCELRLREGFFDQQKNQNGRVLIGIPSWKVPGQLPGAEQEGYEGARCTQEGGASLYLFG